MTLTTIILLVPALYVVQLFLRETSRFGFDLRGIVGNRDNLPEMSLVWLVGVASLVMMALPDLEGADRSV